ncbi:hypothetical protein [Modicisalibacter luteus]|uniref:C2H2-type domain-containing protein n=1 Tax=Modicisalibacter luteus TaxID=453962 RepID=A0ABV7M721_9GAMM|nr:hypothetical protein [Halomonas lutea]GHA99578.1 hypothetical protein GCM10007159_21720 [Halomonas lutea]
MKFPAKLPTGPECPECASREKRFPPGREGAYHVFCDQCGYDFGRFDSLSRHYEHMLDDLERKLGVDPTPR